MTTHNIELRRENGANDSEKFQHGERCIYVDGKPWGRTVVAFHGPRGRSHEFMQYDGPDGWTRIRNGNRMTVRVFTSRRMVSDAEAARPIDDRLMETARELIAGGRLRDPATVAAEREEEDRREEEAHAKRVARENEEFRERAREALALPPGVDSVVIDRVVAAMRWAQRQ